MIDSREGIATDNLRVQTAYFDARNYLMKIKKGLVVH